MHNLIIIPTLNSPKTYPKVPFQYVRTPKLSKNAASFCTYSNPSAKNFAPIIQQYILIKNMRQLIIIPTLNSPKTYHKVPLSVRSYP